MSNRIKHFYEFGGFRFSPKEKCLWRNEELLQLSPKSLEVLNLLLENPNEVVTREEILKTVWEDTFVDEGNLTVAISYLRKALGTDDSSDFIQTVPTKGYRFVADINEIFEDEEPSFSESAWDYVENGPAKDLTASPGEPRSKVRWHFIAILVFAVIFMTSFTLWVNYAEKLGLASVPVNERKIKSIAILPFKDIGKDSGSLSLGLADSLITRLTKLNRFAVRPLSSVNEFHESGKDNVDIGKELKVDAVLIGTIQNAESRLRVNVQLMDIRDGAVIWTDKFDHDEKGLFKLQDSISLRVAYSVLSQLTEKEQKTIAKKTTNNHEAYRLYLVGLEHWLRRDDRTQALRYFEKAVELDPDFALSHLGIADHYALAGDSRKAEEALNKAIRLDPDLHGAIATKGFLQMFFDWDWVGAEQSFKKAIKLSPNSSKAHHWYGVYLCFQKRFSEAEMEMETALALDPTSLVIATDIAELYYFQRDYDEAERRLDKVLRINSEFYPAIGKRAWVRNRKRDSTYSEMFRNETEKLANTLLDKTAKQDEIDEIIARYELMIKRNDKDNFLPVYLDKNGKLTTPKNNRYWYIAQLLAVVGKNDAAIDLLENSLKQREFLLPFIAINPLWDAMRDKPRFESIVREMNLETS